MHEKQENHTYSLNYKKMDLIFSNEITSQLLNFPVEYWNQDWSILNESSAVWHYSQFHFLKRTQGGENDSQ